MTPTELHALAAEISNGTDPGLWDSRSWANYVAEQITKGALRIEQLEAELAKGQHKYDVVAAGMVSSDGECLRLRDELAKRIPVKLPNRCDVNASWMSDRQNIIKVLISENPKGAYMKADNVIEALRAAGCAIEGHENPACVINEASSRMCQLGTKSCVVEHE